MHAGAVRQSRIAPSAPAASAVAALVVQECDRDLPLVSIPRPEVHIAVRFGPSAHAGIDAHALGVRPRVHRKLIRGGQRTVMARLRLGAHEAVLGVPASAITERIVSLEDLWGDVATRRLLERLAAARDTISAAAVLEGAIAERLALARGRRGGARLAFDAADRLKSANVNAVAAELGVSDRHLRRVFRATFGMNPKTFAKLERFNNALAAARQDGHANWARIAAEAGYYDQAHLIAEFRMIAGVTPQALLGELGAAPAVGLR